MNGFKRLQSRYSMPKHPLLSILSHPNATEEMAEKAFLQSHEAFRKALARYDYDAAGRHSDVAKIAAGSRAFSKRLFDKYIKFDEYCENLTHSRHFDHVDMDRLEGLLEHNHPDVVKRAIAHPKFDDWISKVGFKKALNNEHDSVISAVKKHPDYAKWARNNDEEWHFNYD